MGREKVCFGCGESKPLNEFYKHKEMADGHLNKCKECTKDDVISNRAKHIDKYREYDRKRDMSPSRVAARKKYIQTEKGKEAHRKATKKWADNNLEKRAAHSLLWAAIKRGDISKEPCEVCGSTKNVQAHHDDYTCPLDVNWLCPKHHRKADKNR